VIGLCPRCASALGPWEDPAGCQTCNDLVGWSTTDRAVALLETASTPLAYWDVKRALDRDWAADHRPATVSQVLADDLRACWGGRGIYGLYRHGLLPGVRDLGRTAAVYVHTSGRQLTIDEITFIMRHVGYRFSPGSVEPAVYRVRDLGIFNITQGWTAAGEWASMLEGSRDSVQRQRVVAHALRLGRRGPDLWTVLERAASQVESALTERRRRLNGEP
jgi:hypothetical protein